MSTYGDGYNEAVQDTLDAVEKELKEKLAWLKENTNIRPEEAVGFQTAMAYVEAMRLKL